MSSGGPGDQTRVTDGVVHQQSWGEAASLLVKPPERLGGKIELLLFNKIKTEKKN